MRFVALLMLLMSGFVVAAPPDAQLAAFKQAIQIGRAHV